MCINKVSLLSAFFHGISNRVNGEILFRIPGIYKDVRLCVVSYEQSVTDHLKFEVLRIYT